MQPGLRPLAAGAAQLTPLAPGARHQREKLAVLSAFWPLALQVRDAFDAGPALQSALYDRGLITNCTAGDVVRMLPPFVVTAEEIDRALAILADALAAL